MMSNRISTVHFFLLLHPLYLLVLLLMVDETIEWVDNSGVLCVVVFIVRNEISNLSSNPGQAVCISLDTNALGKDTNPSFLPPNYE